MNDEKYMDLIIGHLNGTLTDDEKKQLDSLIKEGKIDTSELQQFNELYHNLGSFEVPKPDNRMKERFMETLEEEKRKHQDTIKHSPLLFSLNQSTIKRAAAAIILLLAGFSAGLLVGSGQEASQQIVTLQQDMEKLKNALVYHSYLQTSASERMQAVGLVSDIETADDQLLMILIHTMNNDPNVNVRLASVDALRNFGGLQNVRNAFIQSLALQDHPLVQMSLIDVLVDLNERNAISEMERLLVTENTLPEIREYLLGGISELRM